MRIVVQIGFCKNLREGQKVSATINGQNIDRDRAAGKYLTGIAQRHSNSWYLAELTCQEGDIIAIEVCTGIRQKGPDESRCFRKTFRVSEKSTVQTVTVQRVGKYGFPLIKGRVEAVTSVSLAQERIAEAEAFLNDEEF